MNTPRVGYARCSTDEQDAGIQIEQLTALGVAPDRIYIDNGLTGTSRARPGLDQALAAVREGDTLTVTKLDRLARSVPDALDILGQLSARGVRFALGGSVYDWNDPFARMFLQILAVTAEFEANLIRQRTREGMARARRQGKLRGKQPKLPPSAARTIRRRYTAGEVSLADLAEEYSVGRSTIHRIIHLPEPVTAAQDR
jgi:DNA invertase Pin-like site-specific DNA recombinase